MANSSPLQQRLTRYALAPAPPEHAHVGYMGDEYGPKRCDKCEYYPKADRCNNRIVIGWAGQGLYGLKLADGLAVVEPGGCSDEFWPKKMKNDHAEIS